MAEIPDYDIVLSSTTMSKIVMYKNDIFEKKKIPGRYLRKLLERGNINSIDQVSDEQFLQLLLSTKLPLIFAEDAIKGNGTDWNVQELQLLGDLNVAMKVQIYDNGVWYPSSPNFHIYVPPLNGTLLFMPGPLLKSTYMKTTPDFEEIGGLGGINQNKYNMLIDRRLSPLLYYANVNAKQDDVSCVVTIPGIGCGAFAGKFHGKMGEHLNYALQYVLSKHAQNFSNIALIYYDPFNESSNQDHGFHNVKYRVRRAKNGFYKSQLSYPKVFEEDGDDFTNCRLFKVVAWDHVSFPGNDFFAGSRNTDDGVSAAATNSMEVITRYKGTYDGSEYLPPKGNADWEEVIEKNGITLRVKENVRILSSDGTLIDLKDF